MTGGVSNESGAPASFTPALGHHALTPLYDSAIALLTRVQIRRSRLNGVSTPNDLGRSALVGTSQSLPVRVIRRRRRGEDDAVDDFGPAEQLDQRSRRAGMARPRSATGPGSAAQRALADETSFWDDDGAGLHSIAGD